MLVSLYVDDMIYTGSSIQLISDFKKADKFEMTDLRKLSFFLGLKEWHISIPTKVCFRASKAIWYGRMQNSGNTDECE